MKRLLAFILVAFFLFSCMACGADTETPDPLGPSDGIKPNDGNKDETSNPDDNKPSGDDTDQPNTEENGGNEEDKGTEDDQPDASLVQSGSFRGEGSMALYLYVEWSAVQKKTDREAALTVDVYLNHYRLTVKRRSGNTVTVNDQTHTFSTDPISLEENVQTRTKLTSYTLSVPREANQKVSLDVEAIWKFSGVLSGEFVDKIQAVSTIELG